MILLVDQDSAVRSTYKLALAKAGRMQWVEAPDISTAEPFVVMYLLTHVIVSVTTPRYATTEAENCESVFNFVTQLKQNGFSGKVILTYSEFRDDQDNRIARLCALQNVQLVHQETFVAHPRNYL